MPEIKATVDYKSSDYKRQIPEVSEFLLTVDKDKVISCESNVHPKFGTEYSCQNLKGAGMYIDKKLPPEKIFNEPVIGQNRRIIGYKNYKGDLLISPELTGERKIIIRKKDLQTNNPPKNSKIEKPKDDSESLIVITPNGTPWLRGREPRDLDPSEVMELIKQRLQKIGPQSSAKENADALARRIGYDELKETEIA